jgi:hypothetical protein
MGLLNRYGLPFMYWNLMLKDGPEQPPATRRSPH